MRSLLATLKKEWLLILRNGISLYMVIAPALLAIVFILVFGAVREANVTIVIDRTISEQEKLLLEQVFDVEQYETTAQMHSRVNDVDSVAGLTREDGEITVIVQGDEEAEFIQSVQRMAGNALAAEPISYTSREIEGKGDFAYRFCLICVYMLSLFIGGSTVGLTSVGERENSAVRAIAISPVTRTRYIAGKLILAVSIGVVGTALVALITGQPHVLPMMALLSLAGVLVCGFYTLMLPAFAANQIAAVGVLKLSMPIALILPLSSVFVPDRWHVLYYWIPMYWQCRGIDRILSDNNALLSIALSFLVAIPWVIGIAVFFSRQIRLNRR